MRKSCEEWWAVGMMCWWKIPEAESWFSVSSLQAIISSQSSQVTYNRGLWSSSSPVSLVTVILDCDCSWWSECFFADKTFDLLLWYGEDILRSQCTDIFTCSNFSHCHWLPLYVLMLDATLPSSWHQHLYPHLQICTMKLHQFSDKPI